MFAWWTAAWAATPADLAAAAPEAREQLASCARDGCAPDLGAEAAWLLALHTYLAEGVADGVLAATVRALDPTLFDDLPPVLRDAASEPPGWTRAPYAPEVTLEVILVSSDDVALLERLSALVAADPVGGRAAARLLTPPPGFPSQTLADAWMGIREGGPSEYSAGIRRPVVTSTGWNELGQPVVHFERQVTTEWSFELRPRRDAPVVDVVARFEHVPVSSEGELQPARTVERTCAGEVAVERTLTRIPCTSGLAMFVSTERTAGRDPHDILVEVTSIRDARLEGVDLESRRARQRALRRLLGADS